MKYLGMLMLSVALLSSGCDSTLLQARYQLHTASDGKAYRLDIKSGEVTYVSPDGTFTLRDGIPTLTVGQYLRKEDGTFLKYLGNGKFEPSKYAAQEIK